jgi:branched-chain amino acid transport system permease protein
MELVQHLINGIALGSIYALLALGYTMVYGVLRLINFAHSDVYMVGAFSGYYFARFLNINKNPSYLGTLEILIIAMIITGALGFLIERLAYRRLRKSPRLNALITAIGVSFFLEYLGQIVFGADPKLFPEIITRVEIFSYKEISISNHQAIILFVSIGLMLVLQYIIFKTRFGKAMRACSFDCELASLMGIPINRIISITFVLGSSLAGAAGILVGINYPRLDPLMGMLPGLKAFIAAVFGGIGNIPGAMVGGLIMGIAEEMVGGYFITTYKDALAFGVLILILLFRPAGIFGKAIKEKV